MIQDRKLKPKIYDSVAHFSLPSFSFAESALAKKLLTRSMCRGTTLMHPIGVIEARSLKHHHHLHFAP